MSVNVIKPLILSGFNGWAQHLNSIIMIIK